MTKKMIIAIITLALLTFIAAGLYNANSLKSITTKETVTIKGSMEEVFDMVKYLNNFPKWSPFLAEDPNQQYEVKGQDGVIGAQYHWNGNKGKDLGYQEIVAIDPHRYIEMKCDIQKPFQAQPTFDYHFESTPNGVRVTQEFELQSGLIDAFFMWLFGAKKGIEKTNQQGMSLLKKAIEGN